MRARIPVLAASLLLAGCMSWRSSSVPAAELLAFEHPVEVRVRTTEGSRLRIFAPLVRNDSIVPSAGPPTGVALAQVEAVEVRQVRISRSVMLGMASLTFLFFSWTMSDLR